MYLHCFLPLLCLGLAITASGQDEDASASAPDAHASGLLGTQSRLFPPLPFRPHLPFRSRPKRPLPIPIPRPGFGGQSVDADMDDDEDGPHTSFVRCGPDFGACGEGQCCSAQGYCGQSPSYCQAPDCLIDYSTSCDAQKSPVGDDTSLISRPHIGDVPYGYTPVYSCTEPKTVALTYDDGPMGYTGDLLDLLDAYDAKATFFVTGINSNKGQIDDPSFPWLKMIQRMFRTGHQIASHTWSHQTLDQLTQAQRYDQMIKNEIAFRNVIGGIPTYMRPPYSSCDSDCAGDMDDMGYHIVYFDVDTDDYNNDTPEDIQQSKDIFDNALKLNKATGRPLLVIAHDVHEQTVYNLTAHMLKRIRTAKYRPVTLGECLGDSKMNWYRWEKPPVKDKAMNEETSISGSKPISPDGTCGTKYTCLGSVFGDCCSGYGYCGNSTLYCGSGCLASAGSCSLGDEQPSKNATFLRYRWQTPR
ncbi:hypothetical protein AJ80_04979 [Polytolypa hystricis UAMH7299]|uniref:Chitin deacetylase n=1 Tax=Polytolypa hystricis (strain UAMH7299) TaxID=1447883 RepID=A0A2B7XZ73_POLH7|nr:hypothetical protein AJ80_04979 [Polytolypa hystricis UAMH7299]